MLIEDEDGGEVVVPGDMGGAEYTAPNFGIRMQINTTTPTERTHRGSIMKCKREKESKQASVLAGHASHTYAHADLYPLTLFTFLHFAPLSFIASERSILAL